MHIVDMVYFWARTMPQRPAVIQPDGILTYRALAEGIESAAEHFARNIPDRSKPVTVSLEAPPKMLIASLGLLRAGFNIIVAGKNDLAHIPPGDSDTLVCERGETYARGADKRRFRGVLASSSAPSRAAAEAGLGQPRTRNADIFFFTSGTTGRPKRVVRTQQAWDQRILFNGTVRVRRLRASACRHRPGERLRLHPCLRGALCRQDPLLRPGGAARCCGWPTPTIST